MVTLTVLGVVALLIVIGATQRKKLLLLIQSNSSSLLNGLVDETKVAKYKVEKLKAQGVKLVDVISTNSASIEKTKADIMKAEADVANLISKAKTAKENGDKDKAMGYLSQKTIKETVVAELKKGLESLELVQKKSKKSFEKIKTNIALYENKAQVIEARASNIKVLEQLKPNLSGDSEIEESIGEIESSIDFKEAKMKATLDLLSEDEVDYSESLNEDYDNL